MEHITETVGKQRSLSNLSPHQGRSTHQPPGSRETSTRSGAAQTIAHEKVADKDGELMARVEAILRSWQRVNSRFAIGVHRILLWQAA